MIERPRNTVEMTRMARGRPLGVMVLEVGSAVDAGIDMLFLFPNAAFVKCGWHSTNGVSSFLIISKGQSTTGIRGSVSIGKLQARSTESSVEIRECWGTDGGDNHYSRPPSFTKNLAPVHCETNSINILNGKATAMFLAHLPHYLLRMSLLGCVPFREWLT
jgi:hypothetical protein